MKNPWTCYFKIRYLDIDFNSNIAQGILVATSFADAATQLEEYYGEDLEEILSLKWYGEGGPILFLTPTFNLIPEEGSQILDN